MGPGIRGNIGPGIRGIIGPGMPGNRGPSGPGIMGNRGPSRPGVIGNLGPSDPGKFIGGWEVCPPNGGNGVRICGPASRIGGMLGACISGGLGIPRFIRG